MPHANPTPSHFPGARASSPASTLTHAHPAAPSTNTPFNKQQATNNSPSPAPPSSSPRSDLRAPSFDFRAPHFTLFLQVLHIASTVIVAIAKRMDSDLHCLTLLQGCEAINCLYSIIRIQLTIDRHPERITPAELRRLAQASRYINRLARQKLDFALYLPTDNPPSTDNEQQTTNNKPAPNPQSDNPQSEIRNPQLTLPRLNVSGLPSTPVCHSPGATLARTCQSLCRILKLLPDLAYDPSGTVATLDLTTSASFPPATPPPPGARASSPAAPLTPANPGPFSPATLLPGARASSPASTPTPANSATPSPNSPINEHQTTSNEPFRIPHFSPPP